MKLKKYLPIILIIIFFTALLVFGVRRYGCCFFDIKFSSLLTLIFGTIISFLLTRSLNNDTKKRKFIDDIVCEIKGNISKESLCVFDKNSKGSDALLKIRNLRNSINLLSKIDEKYVAKKHVNYIANELDEYEKIVDDHIDNISELSNYKSELSNHLIKINDKLNEIRFNLYYLKSD